MLGVKHAARCAFGAKNFTPFLTSVTVGMARANMKTVHMKLDGDAADVID